MCVCSACSASALVTGHNAERTANCNFFLFLCFVWLLDKHVGREGEGDGGSGDTRESFLDLTQTTGSDRALTSARASLRTRGAREKRGEAGDDAPGGGRDEKGIREGRGRERERAAAVAIRGPPHISGCDFGNGG